MESKYQVVSIKENPFQRAGDATFRGPSPSFTLHDFSFVPFAHLLFLILSVSLSFSGKRSLRFLEMGSELLLCTRSCLNRGSELGSTQDHPLALSSGAC